MMSACANCAATPHVTETPRIPFDVIKSALNTWQNRDANRGSLEFRDGWRENRCKGHIASAASVQCCSGGGWG